MADALSVQNLPMINTPSDFTGDEQVVIYKTTTGGVKEIRTSLKMLSNYVATQIAGLQVNPNE